MPDNPVPFSEQIAALRRAVHERAGLAAYSGVAADPHLSALHAALVTLEALKRDVPDNDADDAAWRGYAEQIAKCLGERREHA